MNTAARLLLLAGTGALTLPHLPAQDLLGVTWNGAVILVNSYTGASTQIATGQIGCNSLARASNGTFWSTRRVSATVFDFLQINPVTGSTTSTSTVPDLRGLSVGPGTSLYGIRNQAGADVLVQISTPGGFVSTIGSTGFDGVQGLALHQGVLYAWDGNAGLLIVNPATGAATDPFPGVGGPAFLQTLCSHPDGRLLVGGGNSSGQDSLYSLDVTTGLTTLIGVMATPVTGYDDIRGLEPLAGSTVAFGQGCNGASGLVVQTVTGSPATGGTLTTLSTNHEANAIGLLAFGGLIPPLLLDPLFGTNGCSLYVDPAGVLAIVTSPTAPATMQFSFGVTAAMSGARINLQHICLEAVPGGLSTSNVVAIQIP